jgi:hypothetical protein
VHSPVSIPTCPIRTTHASKDLTSSSLFRGIQISRKHIAFERAVASERAIASVTTFSLSSCVPDENGERKQQEIVNLLITQLTKIKFNKHLTIYKLTNLGSTNFVKR